MNQVNFLGRLGKDAESFTVGQSGSLIVNLSIAINDGYKNARGEWVNKAVWMDVKMMGPAAQWAQGKLLKGMEVIVTGKLAQDEWEDKQTKAKRRKLYCFAQRVHIVSKGERTERSEPRVEADYSQLEEAPF